MAKIDKLTSQVQGHLEEGESVLHSVLGAYETKIMGRSSVRNGAFFATNKKLIFFAKKLTGHDLEIFPYSSISSLEASKGLMGYKISFFASGNKVVMKWITVGGVDEFISYMKQIIGRSNHDKSAESSSSNIDQIERLALLKERGLLSEEEFVTEKKKLLA